MFSAYNGDAVWKAVFLYESSLHPIDFSGIQTSFRVPLYALILYPYAFAESKKTIFLFFQIPRNPLCMVQFFLGRCS
jgi:hypothetical protein